jgi:hypothetical protein
MDRSFRLKALCGVCVLIGACSTNHPAVAPAPPPAAATAAAAPAPAPGDTTGAAPKTTRLYLEDKTLTNEEVKRLFEQGYKPTSRNGEVYYCRREQSLGTRFEKMTCRTADQLKQLEKDSKELLTEKQRPSGCTSQGPGC